MKTASNCLDACGYIPSWVADGDYTNYPLQEALDLQYNFGLFEIEGGTVNKEGIFQYEGDPDQYPLIKMNRGAEILFMYPHAIVAIVNEKGETFITRMD